MGTELEEVTKYTVEEIINIPPEENLAEILVQITGIPGNAASDGGTGFSGCMIDQETQSLLEIYRRGRSSLSSRAIALLNTANSENLKVEVTGRLKKFDGYCIEVESILVANVPLFFGKTQKRAYKQSQS